MLTPWRHWRMTASYWWRHCDHEAWYWLAVLLVAVVVVAVLTLAFPVR